MECSRRCREFHYSSSFIAAPVVDESLIPLWQINFGQYYADETNWIPTVVSAGARGGGALGMFLVLWLGSESFIEVALGLCVGTWMGLGAMKILSPPPSLAALPYGRPSLKETRKQIWKTAQLLSGYAVGTASAIVVQYSIPLLIALVDPERFNAFYLASVLNIVTVAVIGAMMSAALAPFTRWRVSNNIRAIHRTVLFTPALCAGLSLISLMLVWFMLETFLGYSTAPVANVTDVRFFLALLGVQTIIRTSASGFAVFVASSGTARQMALPLLIEMSLVLLLGAPLGWLLGLPGVLLALALSALIGSQASCRMLAVQHLPIPLRSTTLFTALLTAQLGGSALWWWIVSGAVGT